MRIHVGPSARMPVWIAGFVIAVVATSGVVVIARSNPVPYAAASGSGAESGLAPVSEAAADVPVSPAAVPATSSLARKRPACSECAVVQWTRRVESSAGTGPPGDADGGGTGRVSGSSGGALDADAAAPAVHQVTVRHRDGATSVFIETTSRTWRPGSRVILIPGAIMAGK